MMRSGQFVKQPGGYSVFIPAPLPPDPPVLMDGETTRLLSDADRALGRLDGVASTLPNPDLFVAMYVRQEAVLSSQIEGTQSTLEDVLQHEVDTKGRQRPKDVEEVVNYVHAMNYGLKRLGQLPLSLRLLREIHAELMHSGRGTHREPGQFRRIQNWLGPKDCKLSEATFVPPPPPEMHQALGNLEKFLHDRESYPVLIHCGLAHAQFETIHPFLDGNGRVGRLLITFLLCERKVLEQPLLYLSHYFKQHRAEYYDRLNAIRMDGNWEGWLKFFLSGVLEVGQEAAETARSILELQRKHQQLLQQKLGNRAALGTRLLEHLYSSPLVTPRIAQEKLECAYVTANRMIQNLEKWGLLTEITGAQRNRVYQYTPYLNLFEKHRPWEVLGQETAPAVETTESEANK